MYIFICEPHETKLFCTQSSHGQISKQTCPAEPWTLEIIGYYWQARVKIINNKSSKSGKIAFSRPQKIILYKFSANVRCCLFITSPSRRASPSPRVPRPRVLRPTSQSTSQSNVPVQRPTSHVPVLLLVTAPSTELFSKKNHVLFSNFFPFSNMFFIRLFLANNWKKIGCHHACFLTNCRERWTWFSDRSQDGEFARWGLGRDTKWRPLCSKGALDIKLVFGCFYVFDVANTEIHTWEECKNNKEWGKSRFDEILKLWTFSWNNFVALAFC